MESVVGLPGKLGIDSVAEGVETQAQVSCLCSPWGLFAGGYFGRSDKEDVFCCEYKKR
ncbi:hypothetical protein EC2016001_3454 [Escherichia coli 201600.1]|nr:hypothetical protein EC2016001_3454 [Escherichia coli 201600.1]